MSLEKNEFVCQCFYTENYFIHSQNGGRHVTFLGREDFLRNISSLKLNENCTTEDIEEIISELEAEHNRRCSLGHLFLQRRTTIQEKYQPLHPHVYKLQDEYLSPQFLEVVRQCVETNNLESTLPDHLETVHGADRIYRLPVFTSTFCRDLVEELMHFEKSDLPKGRPNTMNNYGILLEELGFSDGLINPLREHYLNPICKRLFPDCGGGALDSHKAFVVTYKTDQDIDLDFHYDNAEVTCNISLNDNFEDGVLYFGDMKINNRHGETDAPYVPCTHRLGHGMLHRGQHMHGALPIADGERYNMIIWMRSSTIRNKLCPMCYKKPALLKTIEGIGDGFTAETVNVCSVG